MKKHFFFSLLVTFIFVSCHPLVEEASELVEENGHQLKVEATCLPLQTSGTFQDDDVDLLSIGFNDRCLELELGHAVGCRPHDLHLYWDGTVPAGPNPKVVLKLYHDSHGEPCKAYRWGVVSYDLSPIKQALGSGVVADIIISGHDGQQLTVAHQF